MSEASLPLLIHSLAEFRQLIFDCLEAADARRIFEIGGEDGTFTRELLEWAEARDADVVCIDPAPREPLEDLARANPRLSLVREVSVVALGSTPPGDAYLIDGDHNYFTVQQELQLISAAAADGQPPLIFLHDVGWPCARRDFYYDPDAIPAEARHEYSWDHGVAVGEPGVVKGGFRGEGQFAVALREGGPGNGVLTAVEDFVRDRPDVTFEMVPAVFGLGLIAGAQAPYADRLAELLRPYTANPLVRRLEQNRLALYLAVLDRQDELAALHHDLAAARRTCIDYPDLKRRAAEQALKLRDTQVENRALWRRVDELEAAQRAAVAPAPTPTSAEAPKPLWRQLRQAVRCPGAAVGVAAGDAPQHATSPWQQPLGP